MTPSSIRDRIIVGSLVALFLLAAVRSVTGAEHSDFLADVEDRCLATTLYFEARGESERGQRAVAETVLNRRDAAGSMVCSVVAEPGQFSWFPGKWPVKVLDMRRWWEMYEVAHDELLKRPWNALPREQVIPLDYTFFCSGDCVRECSGIVIDAQCYYRSKQ